jgi:hypothetical protein
MSDDGDMNEQRENTQINWFAGITLAAGMPLYVLVWTGREWAPIALKVYLCTAVVFGTLLLFLERKSLKKKWLWIGLIPTIPLHAALMYSLVRFNEMYPAIDRVPRATYATLIPVVALETGILYAFLELFKPKKDGRESSKRSTRSDS